MRPVDETAMTVTVRIMGREYTVACPEAEREALVASADLVNERMNTVRRRGKALGAERIAVMVALNLARELLAGDRQRLTDDEEEDAAERIRQLHLDIDSTLSAEDDGDGESAAD